MTPIYTWIPSTDFKRYFPITQVYGICFNDGNEILIIKKPGGDPWSIPGGRPEGNETHEQTLMREMLEEATVKVKNCVPLGVQKVDYPNNPNLLEGKIFYQARFVCEIERILPHTSDPDEPDGFTWERKFVPMTDITRWVDWGDVGESMFADAIALWEQ